MIKEEIREEGRERGEASTYINRRRAGTRNQKRKEKEKEKENLDKGR
jgi:hypothetical protein